MKNHYKKQVFLILGLFCLLSCTKESIVAPATSSAIHELKDWTHHVDPLGRASLISWDLAVPFKLFDSVSAYSAPVKNTSIQDGSPDYMEFITFELDGKRHGWYKSYRRLNETDMEIIIQSIEGKTLRSGFLHKSKNRTLKGKAVSVREMNLSPLEINMIHLLMGIMLGEVTVTAPHLNQESSWLYMFAAMFDYYGNKEDGEYSFGGGGGNQASSDFNDYNYSEIESKLKTPCFNEVLAELKNNNVYGKISEIIQKIDFEKRGLKYSVIINENTANLDTNLKGRNAYVDGNVINLNTTLLKTASKEYIARVIIHEFLHVYINNKFASTDHQVMLNEYVGEIAAFLHTLYKTDEREAKILALLGLQNEKDCYKFILGSLGSNEGEVFNIDQKYKNRNYGKHCN
jgi:hypothetical protein